MEGSAWVTFRNFLRRIRELNFDLINLLVRYDPAKALRPHQAVRLRKFMQNPDLDPEKVIRTSRLSFILVKWIRAAINHWRWCSVDLCREWARVLIAGHTSIKLTLAAEVTPETTELLKWFADFPGCCRLLGGIMLRYACAPINI